MTERVFFVQKGVLVPPRFWRCRFFPVVLEAHGKSVECHGYGTELGYAVAEEVWDTIRQEVERFKQLWEAFDRIGWHLPALLPPDVEMLESPPPTEPPNGIQWSYPEPKRESLDHESIRISHHPYPLHLMKVRQ